MKNKLLMIIASLAFLSGCNTNELLKHAEVSFSGNLDKQNAAVLECKAMDNITIEYTDSGGQLTRNSYPANNCPGLFQPIQHGGQYVSEIANSQYQAAGQLGSAVISTAGNVINTRSSNRTRERVAELERDIQVSDNEVVLQALTSQGDAANSAVTAVSESNSAIVESNSILTSFIDQLINPVAAADAIAESDDNVEDTQ